MIIPGPPDYDAGSMIAGESSNTVTVSRWVGSCPVAVHVQVIKKLNKPVIVNTFALVSELGESVMKILILCTGNSCRSQMAEGFLKSFDNRLEVYSAGTFPADKTHAKAVEVMREAGVDISGGYPKPVENFISEHFDYVITVCDAAKASCPVFTGDVKHRLHMSFEDPADAIGSEEEITAIFRKVRDEIRSSLRDFYANNVKTDQNLF